MQEAVASRRASVNPSTQIQPDVKYKHLEVMPAYQVKLINPLWLPYFSLLAPHRSRHQNLVELFLRPQNLQQMPYQWTVFPL